MKNKYIYCSRISEKKFREILRFFASISRQKNGGNNPHLAPDDKQNFDKLRVLIAQECERINPLGKGEIEIDESYFGARGKIPVFGILKRERKVYTQIVKNCSMQELIPIIENQAHKESTLFTDGFKSYDGLINYGYKRHYRIKHSDNEFACGSNHINGIENFWGLCKVRLSKFRGIKKDKFYLHLKECD